MKAYRWAGRKGGAVAAVLRAQGVDEAFTALDWDLARVCSRRTKNTTYGFYSSSSAAGCFGTAPARPLSLAHR